MLSGSLGFAAIPLITNFTKMIKVAKCVHGACAAAIRTSHNIAEVQFIVCDYLLFKEYVSSCGDEDYSLFILQELSKMVIWSY